MSTTLARRIASRVMPPAVKDGLRGLARRVEFQAAARQGMVPPRHMWTMVGGGAGFVEQGGAFFQYLVEHGRLSTGSSVLDIGCGLGKHAIHFAEYLKPPGRYEGFDVDPLMIRWCQQAIARRHRHLRFQHIAVQSAMYSPAGTMQASQFKFPYASESFDLVFLGSVFTHMFSEDVRHYISEISRVLKPSGICIATLYLLNDDKRRGIAAGTSAFTFAIGHGGSWIESPDPPEGAVAQDEPKVMQMLADVGLTLAEPVRYGSWDKSRQQDQDFVISIKG